MRTRDTARSVARALSAAAAVVAALTLTACAPTGAAPGPAASTAAPSATLTSPPPSTAPTIAPSTSSPVTPSAPQPTTSQPTTSQPTPSQPAARDGAPPPASATPGPNAPLVVLDPGHNGANATHPAEVQRPVPDGRGGTKACNSTGTATDAGYPEHAFTFDVALRAKAALEAAGVRVVLTRPDDRGVGPCVDVRGTVGQRTGAAAVVSIHADGAAPSGTGFHVALAAPPLNPAQATQAPVLGAALHDALLAAGFRESNYIGSRGISPRPDLAGLNLATRPTALVECANMRNAAEAAVVSSPAGRQRYATAIANGVLTYLRG